jgi:ubiquinone/menaquinone biosynthesis C-methylase UbiE
MMDIEKAKAVLGEEFSFFSDIVSAKLHDLDLSKDARILDVGTGQGRLAITLALCGYQVLTGEPSDDNSEYAKQAWLEAAQKVGAETAITFQAFDAEKMPFEKGSFDAIFMMGALHHMNNPKAAVSECVRVMAPAGVFCILEPNAKLVELARAKFPTHPDPIDPRPLVTGLSLQIANGEMFDIYDIRNP